MNCIYNISVEDSHSTVRILRCCVSKQTNTDIPINNKKLPQGFTETQKCIGPVGDLADAVAMLAPCITIDTWSSGGAEQRVQISWPACAAHCCPVNHRACQYMARPGAKLSDGQIHCNNKFADNFYPA